MTQDLLEKYPMWFCFDVYEYAGAPKLERALMDFAKERFSNALFNEEAIQPECVDELEAHAYVLLKKNPRWKPVLIRKVINKAVPDLMYVNIGNMELRLRKVSHYYE